MVDEIVEAFEMLINEYDSDYEYYAVAVLNNALDMLCELDLDAWNWMSREGRRNFVRQYHTK